PTMPRATVNALDAERHELKTLPEGYVTLRRMSYGQSLERRNIMKVSIEGTGKKRDFKGELDMGARAVALYEFQHCIVEHNLEDENGVKLNLASPVGFDQLD